MYRRRAVSRANDDRFVGLAFGGNRAPSALGINPVVQNQSVARFELVGKVLEFLIGRMDLESFRARFAAEQAKP